MPSECDDQYREWVEALNAHVEKFKRLTDAELGMVNSGPVDFSWITEGPLIDLRRTAEESYRREMGAWMALQECHRRHRRR